MDNTGSCLKSCSFTLANSESGKKTPHNFTSSSNLHSKATHFHPTVGMLFFSPPLFILRSVSSHSAFTRLEKKYAVRPQRQTHVSWLIPGTFKYSFLQLGAFQYFFPPRMSPLVVSVLEKASGIVYFIRCQLQHLLFWNHCNYNFLQGGVIKLLVTTVAFKKRVLFCFFKLQNQLQVFISSY